MPAGTQNFEVRTRYVVDSAGALAANQRVMSSAQALDATVSRVARNVVGLLGGFLAFQGIRSILHGAFEELSLIQRTSSGVGAVIAATFRFSADPVQNFAMSVSYAREQIDLLHESARALGFGAAEALPAFQQIVNTGAALGIMPEKLRGLTVQGLTAARVLGISPEEIASTLSRAMAGVVLRRSQLGRILLPLMGLTAQQFTKLGAEDRFERIHKALGRFVDSPEVKKLLGLQYAFQRGVFGENVHETIRRAMGGAFEFVIDRLRTMNAWFTTHREQVNRIADMVGFGIGKGLEHARDVLGAILALTAAWWSYTKAIALTQAGMGIFRTFQGLRAAGAVGAGMTAVGGTTAMAGPSIMGLIFRPLIAGLGALAATIGTVTTVLALGAGIFFAFRTTAFATMAVFKSDVLGMFHSLGTLLGGQFGSALREVAVKVILLSTLLVLGLVKAIDIVIKTITFLADQISGFKKQHPDIMGAGGTALGAALDLAFPSRRLFRLFEGKENLAGKGGGFISQTRALEKEINASFDILDPKNFKNAFDKSRKGLESTFKGKGFPTPQVNQTINGGVHINQSFKEDADPDRVGRATATTIKRLALSPLQPKTALAFGTGGI